MYNVTVGRETDRHKDLDRQRIGQRITVGRYTDRHKDLDRQRIGQCIMLQ